MEVSFFQDTCNWIIQNPKTSVTLIIAVIGVIFSYWRINLMRNKLKMDQYEFNNKKARFSIYLEDCFRTSIQPSTDIKYLLFHVKLTNHSNSKLSVTASLSINYENSDNELKTLKLKHQLESFKKLDKKEMTMLDTDIRVDEKAIKTGWLIFDYPNYLNQVRIKEYIVSIGDGNDNKSSISAVIMKEIIYGT